MAEVVKIKFEVDKSQLDGAITSSKTLEQELKKAGVSAQNMDAAMEGVNDALQEAGVDAKTFAKALDQSATSTKSLKTQLAEAKNEAVRMSQQFGAFSKEAQTAAQKAAKIKDEINDLNDTLDALNPEAKLNAFVKLGQGIQGGFQAATGALQVFGVENERITKLAQQFQGVLNLTQGINSVLQLKDVYGQLRLVLGLTTTAQQGLNTAEVAGTAATRGLTAALAANPFTAVAVALAAVVSGIYLYISATEDSTEATEANNEELERQIENQNKLAEAYQNTSTASSRAIQDQRLKLALAAGQITELQARLEQNELNRQRAVQDFIKEYGADVVGIAEINKKFGLEAQFIKAEAAAEKLRKKNKEVKEEAEKMYMTTAEALKLTFIDVLNTTSEELQSIEDWLELINAEPLVLRRRIEQIKNELKSLKPIYAEVIQSSSSLPSVDGVTPDKDRARKEDLANMTAYLQTANTVVQGIYDIRFALYDAEQQKLEENRKKGLITEENYEKEVKKLKRKAAEDQKKSQYFSAILAGAQGIVNALGTTPANAVPAAVALASITAALNIARIAATPIPQFKKGTLNVGGGNIDSDGGMHAIIHKGEAIIPKHRNMAYHPAIEAIYKGRISPAEINGFVESKLSGKIPSSVNAIFDYRKLSSAVASNSSVDIRNAKTLGNIIADRLAIQLRGRQW